MAKQKITNNVYSIMDSNLHQGLFIARTDRGARALAVTFGFVGKDKEIKRFHQLTDMEMQKDAAFKSLNKLRNSGRKGRIFKRYAHYTYAFLGAQVNMVEGMLPKEKYMFMQELK